MCAAFFKDLLESTTEKVDQMFGKTYGQYYARNDQIFDKLFADLKAYYNGKDENLVDVMDQFWNQVSSSKLGMMIMSVY